MARLQAMQGDFAIILDPVWEILCLGGTPKHRVWPVFTLVFHQREHHSGQLACQDNQGLLPLTFGLSRGQEDQKPKQKRGGLPAGLLAG
jgi:hypothetical protein